MGIKRFALVCAIALLASGCASGPKFAEVKSAIPAQKANEGRVYIYRNSSLGAAVTPTVMVNDKPAGESTAMGFFFIDLPPGPVKVATSTETEHQLTFRLDSGQVRYVRLDVHFGLFVGRIQPQLVDNAEGAVQIEECSYTGTAITPAKK